jgi:hypothetical protein
MASKLIHKLTSKKKKDDDPAEAAAASTSLAPASAGAP